MKDSKLVDCRLCCSNAKKYYDIFKGKGKELNIAKILAKHFWFEIKLDDKFGSCICLACWNSVKNFNKFYMRIYEVHKSFFDNDVNIEIKQESNTDVELIIDESIADLNEVHKSFNNDVNIEIKQESNTDVELTIDKSISDLKVESKQKCDSNVNMNDVSSHDSCDSVSDNDHTNNIDDDDDDDSPSEDDTNNDEAMTKKQKTKLKQREMRKEKLKEEQQIRDYFKLDCELCSAKFNTFVDVKQHYRAEHKVNGYLRCCSKKIFQRKSALDHIQRHINPDAFRCIICNKLYADNPCLMKHMEIHSNPNKVKPYMCTECPRTFGKKYNLDQHLLRHKNNNLDNIEKFNCEECGKTFVSKSKYESHKRVIHEGANAHICEICAKVFKSKIVYEKHRELYHSDVPQTKVQCELCGAWLKHKRGLQTHMRLHEGSDKLNMCDICGKVAPNPVALSSHKKYVHFAKRTHKCYICEKAFKLPVQLKEHMTTHTGEILYICPHCPKTFNSAANMHSHRKKVHTQEWLENRKQKAFPN